MGVADSVQFTLRPKDLEKAADLFGVELAALERFNSQRLLNATYIRAVLVRADYERLTSGLHWLEHQDKKYNFPEVMRALQREYNLSRPALNGILHGRNEAVMFCRRCGIRISRPCYRRTRGLCSNCMADTIEL